jgi:hypothetical protein
VRLEGLFPGFDPLFNQPIKVRTTNQVVLHVFPPTGWYIGEDGTVSWNAAGSV